VYFLVSYRSHVHSGLDSSTSLQVAETLSKLAKDSRKTVICTIHQPSLDMLHLWQNIVLMSEGRVVYAGPIASIEKYFRKLGYEPATPNVDEGQLNPVEFALELLAQPSRAPAIRAAWTTPIHPDTVSFSSARKLSVHRGNTIHSALNSSNTLDVPMFDQIVYLTRRPAYYMWRSIHGVAAMVARNLLGGILFGVLYYKNGNYLKNDLFIVAPETRTFSAYCTNMQTLQFAAVVFIVCINAIAVPAMNSAGALYRREQVT
jgi:hypothetical protein